MEHYAIDHELVIWLSSHIVESTRPVYDTADGRWTVSVSHAGETVVLRPAHIVLATGTLGPPRIPTVPGADTFKGFIQHALNFSGADGFAGKRVLVVGAANTAADICQDLHVSGAKAVTLLQRSSTCFVTSAWLRAHYAREYPVDMPTDVRDLKSASMPPGLLERLVRDGRKKGKGPTDSEEDRIMKDGLRERGFKMNEGWEGLGAWFLVLEKFGGASAALFILLRVLSYNHI